MELLALPVAAIALLSGWGGVSLLGLVVGREREYEPQRALPAAKPLALPPGRS